MMRANTSVLPAATLSAVIVHVLECLAGHDPAGVEPRLAGDRRGGLWVVACDHDDPDSGGPAFRDSRERALPQGIGQADEPHEIENEFSR